MQNQLQTQRQLLFKREQLYCPFEFHQEHEELVILALHISEPLLVTDEDPWESLRDAHPCHICHPSSLLHGLHCTPTRGRALSVQEETEVIDRHS